MGRHEAFGQPQPALNGGRDLTKQNADQPVFVRGPDACARRSCAAAGQCAGFHKLRYLVPIVLALSQLAACPETTEQPSLAGQTDGAVTLSSLEIAELVYDPEYRVPADFYRDERANTQESYTLHHVKDQSNSYELCSDDFAEALSWEAADNDTRSIQGVLAGSYENSRYFEIVRDLAYPGDIGNVPGTTSPGFSRVFKCSYVDRTGVDRHLRDGYAGRMTIRPLTIEATQELVQYLWQFAFFWPGQAKVVATRSGATGAADWHSLWLAIRTGQGAGRCDRIDVVEWRFATERNSGEIIKKFEIVLSFEAQLSNGNPQICDIAS
jgi:hypothetical protein